MKKKKCFTLLEIVIALGLVALCAPLLFTFPFKLAVKQTDEFFQIELERLADVEWCDIKIWLLTNKASLMEFEKKEKIIAFSKTHRRKYLLSREIIAIKEKKIAADREGSLAQIKISFTPKQGKKETSFYYQIAMQKPSEPAKK